MAHGKETPRQKMIGMMYLVLTALLALNVSTSVLDAFKIIDEGLEKTGVTMENKNKEIYNDFAQAFQLNQTKTALWMERANQVRERTQKLYDYIQNLKITTLSEAERGKVEGIVEGTTINRDNIEATTDYDTPHRIMIGDELNDKSEARKLKNEIAGLREFMLTVVKEKELPEQLKTSISKSLDTEPPVTKKKSPEERTWEYHKFGHSPLMGFLAIMSSLQIDLRNAESEMINYLYAQISAGEVKFNELEAVVIPNSNYIIKGNPYRANIFLAARDTTQAPDIYIVEGVSEPWVETTDPVTGVREYKRREGLNYTKVPTEKGTGKGLYERGGSGVGQRNWGGIIEIKGPGGEPIIRPFSAEYTVAEGSAVVSPTKMNVFYLAVDNPVEISVSGVPGNKIRATASNGLLEARGGSWNMRPKRLGNCMVTVSAELDGKWSTVASKEFRVKAVPDPIATVGGQKGGVIAKNVLMAQAGVMATMPVDFEFDLKFNITEYKVGTIVQGFLQEKTVKGAAFSQDIRNLINNVPKGNPVMITDIRAVGPDGTVRDLGSLTFKLN